jgi:hypothetical protein
MIHTDAGGRLLLPFLVVILFCFLHFSAFEKEERKEKSHIGYIIGHMDRGPLRSHESQLEGRRGRRGGRGCVVHVDTLERGADRGREREGINE